LHPWLVFLKESGKRLSDIEFLSIKEFDGKIVSNEGSRTTTGDLATLTASSGKDMYLAKAKIVANVTDASNTDLDIELKVNGVIKETCKIDLINSGTTSFEYEFAITGLKVAATQIIKLEVITITAISEVSGVLECFEETTGESPAV